MFMTKMKMAAMIVLAAGCLAGAGVAGYRALNAGPALGQKPEPEQPKEPRRRDDFEERRAAIELQRKLQPLMEKRLDAIREQLKARAEELLAGKTTVDVLLESSANLLKAQQEMSDKPVDQLKALQLHFERTHEIHEVLNTRFQAGKLSPAELYQAAYNRYDAEIALERYKSKLGPDGAKGEPTKSIFEGTDWKEMVKELP